MANPYPAVFRDDNSETRLAGTVDFTDPANQPGETARAIYEGNAVSIADTASAYLTWNTQDSGDALLDLATPAAPTIVTAGVYAVTVGVYGASLTADGWFSIELILDPDGDYADAGVIDGPPARAAASFTHVASSITYYLPAGAKITLGVTNHDGAASRDFTLNGAVIQRIS